MLANLYRKIGYRWLAILLVVALVEFMELLLLQEKYQLFSGGFLQPYSFRAATDRILLILLTLWMNLLLFGLLGQAWFWLADRLRLHPWMAAFHFIYLTMAGFGVWLALKFKVLTYFADTLDFMVAKNLAGGNLSVAMHYVADQSVLFLITLGVLLLTYLVAWWSLRRFLRDRELPVYVPARIRLRYLLPLILLVTLFLVAWVSRTPKLRYGLKKTTTYVIIAGALDRLSDFDGDGYGIFRFPFDPDNQDERIHPGALDVPGDGIDQDGYGGDFHWSGPRPDLLAELPPRPGKHILLVVLESARADLIGKRWNGQPVAPNLTRMAQQYSHADYAYTHTAYTVTSLLALFNRDFSAPSRRVRLLDYLDRSGYQISIISGQDESFGEVARLTGMKAPGHYYFDARMAIEDRVFPSKDPGSLRLSEARVVRAFRERAGQVDWSRPNFFYVNFQAAHFPYSYPGMPMRLIEKPISRSEIRPEHREAVQATYWNAISVADAAFAQLIDILKAKKVYQDTLVVVLGDHGESLFEDGHLGHGFLLNETQTRIPLIINQKGIQLHQAVGQMDIADLLVSLATGRFDPKQWQDVNKTQFQFIGALQNPVLIDTVRYGEVRTRLDMGTRKVFFSDLRQWIPFDQAWKDDRLVSRLRNLVNQWESFRWEEHLAKTFSAGGRETFQDKGRH